MERTFTIGSDPEVFLMDRDTGKIGSVQGLLGGTKEKPQDIGNGCSVQEDNVLGEFNIPPVTNFEDFYKHIEYCKDYISTKVSGHGLDLHYSSSEMIDDDIITPETSVFGCAPSLNVISESFVSIEMENLPEEVQKLRSSGFHIHFGSEDMSDDEKVRMVLCFEMACSIPLSFYDIDKHNRRRLYGLFGDCRFKDYGVECRSLGGSFLENKESIEKVWQGIEDSIKLFNSKITTSELHDQICYILDEDDSINEQNYKEVKNNLLKQKIELCVD